MITQMIIWYFNLRTGEASHGDPGPPAPGPPGPPGQPSAPGMGAYEQDRNWISPREKLLETSWLVFFVTVQEENWDVRRIHFFGDVPIQFATRCFFMFISVCQWHALLGKMPWRLISRTLCWMTWSRVWLGLSWTHRMDGMIVMSPFPY